MIVIETYFLGPTTHRGSRIAAKTSDSRHGRVVLSWDHGMNPDANHEAAAKALAEKCGWAGEWVSGHREDGSTMWVNTGAPVSGALAALVDEVANREGFTPSPAWEAARVAANRIRMVPRFIVEPTA